MFTYFALKQLVPIKLQSSHWIGYPFGIVFIIIGLVYSNQTYTSTTFTMLGVLVFILALLRKSYLLQFLFSYLFVLIPFFLINGVLTGNWIEEPVVWYNDSENLGIRMWTIPMEDAFYGMLLLLLNVTIWERTSELTN